MEMKELLIGKTIKITKVKNKTMQEMTGKVINETKNLLVIETNKGIKKIIKSQIKFEIENEREERK